MYTSKLDNYKYGFFWGSLFDEKSDDKASVAIQHFKAKQIIAFWYRKIDTEYYVIVDGKMWVDGNIYTAGDVIVYEPYDVRKVIFLEDTNLVVLRTPGTDGDYYNDSNAKNSELVSFINELYGKSDLFTKSNVKYDDISVVVQGPISDVTHKCVDSIRRYLPGAEVIISTWNGSNVSGIPFDKVVFSDDPGGISVFYKGKQYTDNTNRQLVSIQKGLQEVSRKFVLKLRSDCVLYGDGIVKAYGKYKKRDEKYKFFSERIVIGESFNVESRSYLGNVFNIPYMVSDWFYFGKAKDIRLLFENIPQVKREEVVNYQYKNPISFHRYMRWNKIFRHRYCAEQYYLINALRKRIEIKYDDLSDANENNIMHSKNIIFNNFVVLNITQHQIINLKKIEDSIEGTNCFVYEKRYGHDDFIEDYNRFLLDTNIE